MNSKNIDVLFSISFGNPNIEIIAKSASRIIGFLNSESGETIPIILISTVEPTSRKRKEK